MGRKSHKKRKIPSIAQRFIEHRQPAEFIIKPTTGPSNEEALETTRQILSSLVLDQPKGHDDTHDPRLLELLKLLPELATGIWRARQKMLAPGKTDEPREEMRRAFRPLDATFQNMLQAGIQIVDRTNQPYMPGFREKVIAFEPTDGISTDTVIETIKPTILFQNELLQLGEIIVGTPKDAFHQTPTPTRQENSQ